MIGNKIYKKTQQTQYADDDNHPFQTNEISHGGVVLLSHDDLISIPLGIYKYIF